MALPKRELGRTGLPVTVLGYGAMELRGAPRGRDVTEAQVAQRRQQVKPSLDLLFLVQARNGAPQASAPARNTRTRCAGVVRPSTATTAAAPAVAESCPSRLHSAAQSAGRCA